MDEYKDEINFGIHLALHKMKENVFKFCYLLANFNVGFISGPTSRQIFANIPGV